MRRSRGVTLVELLVVLAIVALLGSFFAVRMSTARSGAEENSAQATAASLASAVSSFYLANGCYPRDVVQDTVPGAMEPYVGGQWPVGFDYEQWGYDIGISWRPNGSYRWTVWVSRGVAVSICP